MSTRSRLVVGAAGILLAAIPGAAQGPQKPGAVVETAVVYITRSYQSHHYQHTYAAFSDGGGIYMDGRGHGISAALSHRLFNQLEASMPLQALPKHRGKQNDPAVTSTYVVFRGEGTPDLTLPGNDQAKAIKEDVDALLSSVR